MLLNISLLRPFHDWPVTPEAQHSLADLFDLVLMRDDIYVFAIHNTEDIISTSNNSHFLMLDLYTNSLLVSRETLGHQFNGQIFIAMLSCKK